MMNIDLWLERKKTWCTQNATDQASLGNERNSSYWTGRSESFREVQDALKLGIVTDSGVTQLATDEFS